VWEDPVDSERRRRWWRERYLPTLERLAAVEPDLTRATALSDPLGVSAVVLGRRV
jgi:hypothetical protein